ncbi:MAG: hypothetical protein AAGI88_09080 [Pseudomonadota bacterium]
MRIDATSEQLRRELKVADGAVDQTDRSIGQKLERMQKRFNDTAARAAKLGAAAAAAGAAITAKLVASGLASVDSLAKVSDRLGIATENLAALRFAAEQTGVSTQTLDMALQRMTRRVAEAANGTGEAKGAIEELGLEAKALNELAPDQVFRAITEAMEGVDNQSDKVRLAMKLFDSEGVSLVQTMNAGADALDDFAEQARIAGLTVNEFDAAKVEATNDAFHRVSKLVEGLGQQLAIRFAPILEGIADRLFGVSAEAGGMAKAAGRAFDFILGAAGVVANSVRVIEIALVGVKTAFLNSFPVAATRLALTTFDTIGRAAISMWNSLPFTQDREMETWLTGLLETIDQAVEESRAELNAKLMEPLPSRSIKEWGETTTRVWNASVINVGKLGDATSLLAVTTDEVTKQLAEDWDRALQGTFERIDSAFADAWRGALDSFSDFATGLKDAFKNLIAELAHLAITKPILLNIGAALGIGGATSSAMASTGIGSIFSGGGISGAATSLLGGIGNAGAGLYNAIGSGASFLADFGIPGMDALSVASFGRGMTTTGWGALGNLGAGLAGGFLGQRVFGEGSGIGSALGGIGGSIFGGPIGAALGSFLGSGIDALFGGGKPSQNFTSVRFASNDRPTAGLSAGGFDQFDTGTDTTNSAAMDIVQTLNQFRQILGGSNQDVVFNVGDQNGLYLGDTTGRGPSGGPNFNGYTFNYGDDAEGFFVHAFQQMVSGADHLGEALQSLLMKFDGTSEQLMAFSGAMINVSESVGSNVVRDLRDAWSDMSSNTALDAYQRQITAISDLVVNFDSSVASAQNLSAALAQNQQAAAQLAAEVLQLATDLGSMFGNSAQQIRESVMSEEELFQVRTAERDALRQSLNTMADPEQIARTAQEINRLNTLLFNSLENPGQAMAEEYASYAESTNELVQTRLDSILDNIEQTQERQNQRIQDMMTQAAAAQQAAANTLLEAAYVMDGAVSNFGAAAEANA